MFSKALELPSSTRLISTFFNDPSPYPNLIDPCEPDKVPMNMFSVLYRSFKNPIDQGGDDEGVGALGFFNMSRYPIGAREQYLKRRQKSSLDDLFLERSSKLFLVQGVVKQMAALQEESEGGVKTDGRENLGGVDRKKADQEGLRKGGTEEGMVRKQAVEAEGETANVAKS